jgi:pimeloyl-ACP methyl ester carboxylesterase
MTTVASQFIDVEGRRVLVRYAGTGPAVVLLHQSPQTSRSLIPWIERLAKHYAVIAPDTPGFGFSDPLALSQPTIPDYASALNMLMDKLGITSALIFGVHTGAVTALRFSLDYPNRVAGLVCDGYARFNRDERQKLLNGYLPPFEPDWHGGHLLWLWARFREQNLYFPWNVSSKEARIAYPAPSTEKLHHDVMDLLDAGDGYRIGYRAPFLYDDAMAASRLTVEGKIYYRAEDVLAAHLPRLQNLPPTITAERLLGGAAELVEKTDQFFATRAAHALAIDSAKVIQQARSSARQIVETPHGALSLRLSANGGDVSSQVEVQLNDIGFPTALPVGVAHGIFVVSPELPGHGASRPWATASVESTADAILFALDKLGVKTFSISADGGAGSIAALLAMKAGARCRAIKLHNPLPLSAIEAAQFLFHLPDSTPHSTGAHLVAAWNWARMKHLFWPWLPQISAAVRHIDAPAPQRLHGEVLEIIRAGGLFEAMWREVLSIDLASTLAKFHGEITVTVDDEVERLRLVESLVLALKLQVRDDASVSSKSWCR